MFINARLMMMMLDHHFLLSLALSQLVTSVSYGFFSSARLGYSMHGDDDHHSMRPRFFLSLSLSLSLFLPYRSLSA